MKNGGINVFARYYRKHTERIQKIGCRRKEVLSIDRYDCECGFESPDFWDYLNHRKTCDGKKKIYKAKQVKLF